MSDNKYARMDKWVFKTIRQEKTDSTKIKIEKDKTHSAKRYVEK